jgi:homoserine kinase type II
MVGMESDEALLRVVLAHYDLGDLVAFERDQRGTVNTSFIIDTLKDGQAHRYFLRRYKPSTLQQEIEFEHSLVNSPAVQASCPVARAHPTRSGATFLRWPAQRAEPQSAFYAVFDYLPGEDRYTWVGPRCTPTETRNAGALLARLHAAAVGLETRGRRAEPKIRQLLDVIETTWNEGLSHPKTTAFDDLMAASDSLVRGSIAGVRRALDEAGIDLLPEVVGIHCDYHPGNLRFEGEAISGLVDFDWAKLDLRLFDVGLAVWYFCVSWENPDGELRLEDTLTFVAAYQEELLSGSSLVPLSPAEIRLLPAMISAGNIYVINWTMRDYFGKDVDPVEYLVYLKHHVASARWFTDPANQEALAVRLAGLPVALP